jgi:hypothetical protein
MPSKNYKRKKVSSSSEEEVAAAKCYKPKKVYCPKPPATLGFSGNFVNPAGQPPPKNWFSCTAYFLHDGFDYQAPASQAEVEANISVLGPGNVFDVAQIVPADTTCATIGWRIAQGALVDCERYTISLARLTPCGSQVTIELVATIEIPVTQGLDLCGRQSAVSAVLNGAKTVPAVFKQGELAAVYFNIKEVEPCPVVCCDPANLCPTFSPVPHYGPGLMTVEAFLS